MDNLRRHSFHEAAHAIVGALAYRAGRGPALRHVTHERAMFDPHGPREVEAALSRILAGRIAEELAGFADSHGDADDQERALDLLVALFLRALPRVGIARAREARDACRVLLRRAAHNTTLDLRLRWPAVRALALELEHHGSAAPEMVEMILDRSPDEPLGSPAELRELATRAGRPGVAAAIAAQEERAQRAWLATVARGLELYLGHRAGTVH